MKAYDMIQTICSKPTNSLIEKSTKFVQKLCSTVCAANSFMTKVPIL